MNMVASKQQKGMSLVELLVSMVIGIFLLGGIITNFVSTKDSDRVRNAISIMDANALLAIDKLTETVRHTGYTSIHNKYTLDKPFYTKSDGVLVNPTCRNGINRDKYRPSWGHRTRDHSRGDRLTMIVLADNPCVAGQANCANVANVNPKALVYTDCVGGGATRTENRVVACSADNPEGLGPGMMNPLQARIYSSFFLGGGNNKNVLYCKGSRGGKQPIANNIQAMQFLYGVKEQDGSTVYRRANVVENASDWGKVNSVQVGLLMRSSKTVLSEDSDKTKYVLLDKNINIPSDDRRRLFRVYTATINLENRNKAPL